MSVSVPDNPKTYITMSQYGRHINTSQDLWLFEYFRVLCVWLHTCEWAVGSNFKQGCLTSADLPEGGAAGSMIDETVYDWSETMTCGQLCHVTACYRDLSVHPNLVLCIRLGLDYRYYDTRGTRSAADLSCSGWMLFLFTVIYYTQRFTQAGKTP